jgi:hypothetical protein
MRAYDTKQRQDENPARYSLTVPMDPAALLAGGGEHLPQRPPQPQRPVADHDHRRAHAAAAAVPQQLGPVVGRLAGTVGDRDQLLGAVGPHAHEHQAAQPSLVAQTDVAVDAVRPAVHIVPVRQVPSLERLAFGLPLDGQPGDDRRGQARTPAEECLQGGHEVLAGQTVQIQQRQHLGDLRRAPAPARQEHALEPLARARRRVDPPVVHSWAHDLDLADAGADRPGRGMAIADHQPVAALVDQLGVRGDVGLDLGLQRNFEHPASTLAEQFVHVGGQLGPCLLVNHYTQHRGVPSSPALARRRSLLQVRVEGTPRSHARAHPQVSTIARS